MAVGSVLAEDPLAPWKSDAAKAIRESILDGSFRFCNEACWYLAESTGPVSVVDGAAPIRSPDAPAPRTVNLAYDRSCMLVCPSCRSRRESYHRFDPDYRRAAYIHERALAVLANAEWAWLSGSGDPFASDLLRGFLIELDRARFPNLKLALQTNGLALTRAMWDRLERSRDRIKRIDVSVDAATEATYMRNRVGSRWTELMANLDFLGERLARGDIEQLSLNFVVQANNWREMPAFVELANRLQATRVRFDALRNWRFMRSEYAGRAVHLPGHPEHQDFLDLLRTNGVFESERVRLGSLAALVLAPASNTAVRQDGAGVMLTTIGLGSSR